MFRKREVFFAFALLSIPAVVFLCGSSSPSARTIPDGLDPHSGGSEPPISFTSDSADHSRSSHPELSTPTDTSKANFLSADTSNTKDTLKFLSKEVRDSLARADSIRRIPRDSVARVAQFLYHRTDSLVVPLFDEETYSMFAQPPSLIIRSVMIDSTGQYVIVRETVNGQDIKIPQKVPLDEYIRMRYRYEFNRKLEDAIYKYDIGKKKNDLSDLLGSFTNIDIPIPANPVFSIFGPPRINLHISGAVDIHAAFRNTTTDQVTLSALGNTVNEPDFSQEVQINVSGTIGDKLNILADWNTQRTFEYENQLKIKYTGYDDEIVQSVEAGNVSLATNSTFISPSAALFGIKSAFQFGPLTLTAIASQKKGQIQQKNITGGSSQTSFTIHAYQYNTDHYFVDTSYIPLFEQFYTTHQGDGSKEIVSCEVWVTNTVLANPNARQGVAFINLSADSSKYAALRNIDSTKIIPGQSESGLWQMLESGKDYTFQPYAGYITLNRSLQPDQAIAMAYRVQNGPGSADDSIYGTFTGTGLKDSVLVLKLIKPKTLLPQYKQAWRLLLKNIYSLGGQNISKNGFALHIYYTLPGKDPVDEIGGVKLLQLLGFDNLKDDNSPGSDNNFDYNPPYTVDEARGEIIFPSVEPFLGVRTDPERGPLQGGLKRAFDAYKVTVPVDSFSYGDVYDTTMYGAQNNSLRDRFTIVGQTTAGSTNTINLGFNIVENSVQVLLNGIPLTVNVDYTVDYIVGQVIIKNPAALVPGANLQVKYEQNDLFQLASKTLTGARGELKLSDRSSLGFTVMNLNQQTLSEKVRLNEEPSNNTIYGFDGQTGGNLDFVTKAIDALPLISTKAPSDFTLHGEVAEMSPDPNTAKSTIGIDNGQGIAYVDDFEGANKTIPFGVSYGSWHDMSVPAYLEGVDPSPDNLGAVTDSAKMTMKAKAYWYTIPNSEPVTNIWPNRSVARGEEYASIFHVDFNPKGRGEYNFSPNLRKTLGIQDGTEYHNWGGMQRTLSSGIVDLIQENVNFIEVWLKIAPGSVIDTVNNKVFIDLGAISEDVIPGDAASRSGQIHTEDNLLAPTGAASKDKDTGLDRLFDDQERQIYGPFIQANATDFPDIATDPAGDDYAAPSGADYSHINGTENNLGSETGLYPDTDDLNRNNVLDKTNSYFEYELDLDTTASNPQRVGGGAHGWYQYRIPLIAWKNKVGTPDLSLIEYARMWFTGFSSEVHLEIADFNLVGNQWEELIKNDSTFTLSVENLEDNPDYISPPGVSRARDLTKPDENVYENEQSLVMQVRHLHPGDSRQAIKRFTAAPLDVFSYRELKMFVRGDPNFSTDPNAPSAKIFLRMGSDSLNYYEYREPILPSARIPYPKAGDEAAVWSPENNIDINFADLTAIKELRDSSNVLVTNPAPGGPPGSTYSVLGNPTLTNIQYISIGVENPTKDKTIDSANVWVNELRLCNVDDTKGWAYNISTSLKLADFGAVAFSYSEVDPYFHQLEDRFGSRTTTTNWTLSSNFALERFFPAQWTGTQLPFSYSHTEAITKPKYLPSSDIEVTKAAQLQGNLVAQETGSAQAGNAAQGKIVFESQSISTTDTYAMPNFKFNIPSQEWILRDFFDKLNYGFSYTKSLTRTPTVQYQNSWSWNAHLGYTYATAPDNFITPFGGFFNVPLLKGLKDFRLFYPIQNFSTTFDATRAQTHQLMRGQDEESPPSRTLSAQRSLSFSWKLTENGFVNLSGDYSLSIASTLVHLETDQFNQQRGFSSILADLFNQDQLITFGYDNSYSQSINVNTRPHLPDVFDLNKYFTLGAHYSVSYRWQNNLQLGDLGKGTSWGNSISLSSDISLKQFSDSWFPAKSVKEETPERTSSHRVGRGRGHEDDPDLQDILAPSVPRPSVPQPSGHDTTIVRDTLKTVDTSAVAPLGKKRGKFVFPKINFADLAQYFIKIPFLDYDKVNVTFSQNDNATNSGVPGRPGFANLFGRLPFEPADPSFGASRAYQFGLVSDPTSNITGVHTQSAFPFIGFTTDHGSRAASALINDSYTQNNKITLRTSRDLWAGAHLDLNWDVGWNYSRNQTLQTDSLGQSTIYSTATGGSIERSFFTLPPTFIFSVFKSGIGQVSKEYGNLQQNNDGRTDQAKLAQAFENGFETLPIFTKLFGDFFPRLNYAVHWDGLEQLSIFKNIATHVSLDHAYTSSYQTTFHEDLSGGGEITDAQHIGYGFSPLLGMSFTFKEFLKGNMSATLRYSTTTTYDLTPSSNNIVENGTKEISISGTYGRTGFEIPFFGLSLSNDIDISISFSYSDNALVTYTGTSDGLDNGVPGVGSSRSVTEPRIRYVLSSRVTASLFYRYTKVSPDAGGSTIPGSTTNEGGLDVHIAIQ
ncbi:MAG TPA: cell surface protein SprA [Bacteroidota bacterium]|nr:cell surface protein SprA [Bacteroidota bacterium]